MMGVSTTLPGTWRKCEVASMRLADRHPAPIPKNPADLLGIAARNHHGPQTDRGSFLSHYLEQGRYRAAEFLLGAVEQAYADIDADPLDAKTKPHFTRFPYFWVWRYRY
jgi:hypothetical protein